MARHLGELDALCRAMEGVAQLAGRGPCLEALDAECELWSHPKLPPGGMAADPQRSIEGLRRIIRAPEVSPTLGRGRLDRARPAAAPPRRPCVT